MQRIFFNFVLAINGVNANKLRSILTALGIIFGVGAVIAMLAIGNGAKQSILEQMKLIGTNNIVVKSVPPTQQQELQDSESTTDNNQEGKNVYSPGLTLADVEAIENILPTIEKSSPEVVINTSVIQSGRQKKGKCIGVNNAFFELNALSLERGHFFHDYHSENSKPVCIVGKSIQSYFFEGENPIGKKIKCGENWLTIIGLLEKRRASKESLSNLGIRDYNEDIYIPVNTALLRFKNKAAISQDDLNNRDSNNENYHQLNRVVFRLSNSQKLDASATVLARLLKRRHRGVLDYEIEIPELLLQQEQKTQDTFNFVLAVIAGISLLVGGIGIMNIMLASVLERIKEIGLRRSLGATQTDINSQFLFEAVIISLIGGLLGIILGLTAAKVIAFYAKIPAIASWWSVILAFGVAATIGLIFGYFPAQKAAKLDPIKALRAD